MPISHASTIPHVSYAIVFPDTSTTTVSTTTSSVHVSVADLSAMVPMEIHNTTPAPHAVGNAEPKTTLSHNASFAGNLLQTQPTTSTSAGDTLNPISPAANVSRGSGSCANVNISFFKGSCTNSDVSPASGVGANVNVSSASGSGSYVSV